MLAVLWLAEWETLTDTLVEGEGLWLAEMETLTDTLVEGKTLVLAK